MNTQNQDYIIEQTGAENWEMIIDQFAGKTQSAVKAELDKIFTSDDNADLAERISEELS